MVRSKDYFISLECIIHIFNTYLHLQSKSEVMGNQWEQSVTMNSTGLFRNWLGEQCIEMLVNYIQSLSAHSSVHRSIVLYNGYWFKAKNTQPSHFQNIKKKNVLNKVGMHKHNMTLHFKSLKKNSLQDMGSWILKHFYFFVIYNGSKEHALILVFPQVTSVYLILYIQNVYFKLIQVRFKHKWLCYTQCQKPWGSIYLQQT